MKKDKYNFILELVRDNKLSRSQKDRLLELSALEFQKDASKTDERLSKIEEVLKGSGEAKKEQNNKPLKFPIIHNPYKTVELLKHFTIDNSALKYSTHSWEMGKFSSYDNFIEQIETEWKKDVSDNLKNLNERLHAKISNFLFNKHLGLKNQRGFYNAWGRYRLKFGWSSPQLKKYMDSGENKDPFRCPIPENIKALEKEKKIFFFEDYVNQFKNEIEVREDNKTLNKIINSLWENELSFDFHVKTNGEDGVSFFTDVAYFEETIKLIFKSFRKRTEFPNITIDVDNDFDNKICFIKITQEESLCTRDIKDPKISLPNSGDLSTIITNLRNLANFSISANFKDGNSYRINILSSNNSDKHIEKIDSVIGFTYELKFPL